ncbi:galactosylceramide sulfotransferase-like [Antedon mediterranea]|uniref:galactosylceramide sulfotransferase-like n=1 Tax=Antedon mediterranea TaxID=105859 RepID=UPI003AF6414D
MATLAYYYRNVLLVSLFITGCSWILWSKSPFDDDRSILNRLWEYSAPNVSVARLQAEAQSSTHHTTYRPGPSSNEQGTHSFSSTDQVIRGFSINAGQGTHDSNTTGVTHIFSTADQVTHGSNTADQGTHGSNPADQGTHGSNTTGQITPTLTDQTTPKGINTQRVLAEYVTEKCTPRKNIAFLKTHKCGSSTMQNILLRYGDQHNLTFALPKIGNNQYDHMYTLSRPLITEFVEELPVPRYNMLCHHCIYNETAFKNIVYDGALIMTVIRSPVRVFESTFSYFGYAKHLDLLNYTNPLLEFINRAEKADPSNAKYVKKRNPMLNAFGLKDKGNESVIDSIINNVKSSMQFAVITDHFDESLIILKERLCWDFDDIVYFPQLVRKNESRNIIDDSLADRIKKWNFGDVKLFDYFNQSLWREIEEFGRDRMRKELKQFRERKEFWKEKCTNGINISRYFVGVKSNGKMEEGSPCWRMTRLEVFYTRYIRQKQRVMFNITTIDN